MRSCEINNSRHTKGCYIQYKAFGDETLIKTKVIKVSSLCQHCCTGLYLKNLIVLLYVMSFAHNTEQQKKNYRMYLRVFQLFLANLGALISNLKPDFFYHV